MAIQDEKKAYVKPVAELEVFSFDTIAVSGSGDDWYEDEFPIG